MVLGSEPGFILKNGNPNPAWLDWYMTIHECNENKARFDWWDKLRKMVEPSLMTAAEKPNLIWVAWWRARTACSTNIALRTCKSKIAGTWTPHKKVKEWLGQKKTERYLNGLI